ncbi:hypothetical protein N1851_032002 [Merluccius polli]|uniref:Uncharacterized protein n=1 Tax=Merluccius polli TaxID=89951 RepID=A0AA47M3C8_MERPO|nr:hypothetical protein N1851_032002 [Merluccius polli]
MALSQGSSLLIIMIKYNTKAEGQTLNGLRANGYLIVGGMNREPTPPFTYCAWTASVPFHTKQGRKEQKRYGLLFTCLCSRAVHIEMLEDMTTDAFIMSLRCFVAIRW